ncbi:hypothetical protein CQA16_25350, partial [Enterobacter hormaechei]
MAADALINKEIERIIVTRPVLQANEVQRQYMNAIKHQKFSFCDRGKRGVVKTFLSAAMAADALINKEIERIIVTRPV